MNAFATRRIPCADLRAVPETTPAVPEQARGGLAGLGSRSEAIERDFARRIGVRHAVALSSSATALHLAYLAAGVGPGDEVIVSALTAASVDAAIYCGARPVFADIAGQHDLNLDPVAVERRIGPRTRAIAAVHLAGYAAPIAELRDLCERRGVALIEDASHAPDTMVDGDRVGTFGLAGAFSLGGGDAAGGGGLLVTDDPVVAKLARRRRSPGVVTATWMRCLDAFGGRRGGGTRGFDYRFDEPRAALLQARMARLDVDVARRRALVGRYREAFDGLSGISVPWRDVETGASSCTAMPIMLDEPDRRRGFRRRLLERHGVQTRVLAPSAHWLGTGGDLWLPRVEHALATEVTLPLYPHLRGADQDRVIAAVEEALRA